MRGETHWDAREAKWSEGNPAKGLFIFEKAFVKQEWFDSALTADSSKDHGGPLPERLLMDARKKHFYLLISGPYYGPPAVSIDYGPRLLVCGRTKESSVGKGH